MAEAERSTRRAGRLGPRGGAGRGGGGATLVPVPPEWVGTTRQVAGLYPWAVPASPPTIGVPVGRHQRGGGVVCFDPATWYRAGLVTDPSALVVAAPGLGAPALVGRWGLGLAAMGYRVLVAGDPTPDHVALTRALGGAVRVVRRSGEAVLNPCDPGGLRTAAARIGGQAGEALRHEAVERAAAAVHVLVRLTRRAPVPDHERAALVTALRLLHVEPGRAPTLPDLLDVLSRRPGPIRAVVLAPDDDDYDVLLDPLRRTLLALLAGPCGDVLSRPVDRDDDEPSVLDLDTSAFAATDPTAEAVVLLCAWAEAHARVEAARVLARSGVEAPRRHAIVLARPGRVLRVTVPAGVGDDVARLTRLDRDEGACRIVVADGVTELLQGDHPVGPIEPGAGVLVAGGLPRAEVEALAGAVPLTDVEAERLVSWAPPGAGLRPRARPSGWGRFIVKPGAGPGVPVDLVLTGTERSWYGGPT